MRIVLTVLACCAASCVLAADDLTPEAVLRTVFPRDVEVELALSAAPSHLRERATVYVYGRAGYEKLRSGSNGLTCLLNRDGFFYGAKQFKPTCWDEIGEATYVPVMLKVGEMLAANAAPDAIRAAIDAGFARGEFRAPTRSGVAYMLAGDVDLDLGSGGVLRQGFPGHYMFYAVGATSAQLGVTREAFAADPSLPIVFEAGAGGAHGLSYIIAVPARTAADSAHEHEPR